MRYCEYTGHHRGLRAGHASPGVTRELGRTQGLLGDKSGAGVPPSVGKTPGVERKRPPFTRALGDQGTQSKKRAPKGSGKATPGMTTSRGPYGRYAGLTNRIHETPENGATGTTLSSDGVQQRVSSD